MSKSLDEEAPEEDGQKYWSSITINRSVHQKSFALLVDNKGTNNEEI